MKRIDKNLRILIGYAISGIILSVLIPYASKSLLPLDVFIDFEEITPIVEDGNVSFLLVRDPQSAFPGEYIVDLVLYEKDAKSTEMTNVYKNVIFEPSDTTRHLVKNAFTNVKPGEYYLDMFIRVDLGSGVERTDHLQSEQFSV